VVQFVWNNNYAYFVNNYFKKIFYSNAVFWRVTLEYM